MTNASPAYRALIERPFPELFDVMRRGEKPDFDGLAGWEYKGFNRPWYLKLVGIQKFVMLRRTQDAPA